MQDTQPRTSVFSLFARCDAMNPAVWHSCESLQNAGTSCSPGSCRLAPHDVLTYCSAWLGALGTGMQYKIVLAPLVIRRIAE